MKMMMTWKTTICEISMMRKKNRMSILMSGALREEEQGQADNVCDQVVDHERPTICVESIWNCEKLLAWMRFILSLFIDFKHFSPVMARFHSLSLSTHHLVT